MGEWKSVVGRGSARKGGEPDQPAEIPPGQAEGDRQKGKFVKSGMSGIADIFISFTIPRLFLCKLSLLFNGGLRWLSAATEAMPFPAYGGRS
jgi:hypothetical protein